MNADTPVGGSRLPDQLRRERLLDMERRLVRHRRAAFGVLTLALLACGPFLGWWWLIPLGVALLAYQVTDGVMQRSERPAAWAAAGWAVSPLMIGLSVALTGAADSPALAWFALPAVTLAPRFERRGVVFGIGYIAVLMLASTVAIEPAKVWSDPSMLIFSYTAVIAAVILSGAVSGSDREHRQEAVLDPLTGLLNRSALAQRFDELEQQSWRDADGEPIAFIIGDLDRFKAINDRHGHATGDVVLREAAYAMRGVLRAFDLAYRVGGEEFVVLLPGATLEEGEQVAERLRAAVEDVSTDEVQVSMSLGVACASGGRVELNELFRHADTALYRAKRDGRNRVRVASGSGLASRSL